MVSKMRVFISYAQEDSEWKKKFEKVLINHGIGVWDTDKIRPGDNWREEIEKELRESDIIVTLIDKNNVKSPWVFFELGAAIGMGKKVVAIISKDLEISQLPQELRLRSYLIKESPEKTAEEFLEEKNQS